VANNIEPTPPNIGHKVMECLEPVAVHIEAAAAIPARKASFKQPASYCMALCCMEAGQQQLSMAWTHEHSSSKPCATG
jgi:hypothetical protein